MVVSFYAVYYLICYFPISFFVNFGLHIRLNAELITFVKLLFTAA